MIQATELRIGNWVSNGRLMFQITLEDFYDLYDPDSGITEDYFEPIPLSPDILEKCGFVKWDEDEESGITRFNKTHSVSHDFLIFSYRKNGKMEFCIDCDEFSKLLSEVQHLHQLQNLYFALTGEELTLNL